MESYFAGNQYRLDGLYTSYMDNLHHSSHNMEPKKQNFDQISSQKLKKDSIYQSNPSNNETEHLQNHDDTGYNHHYNIPYFSPDEALQPHNYTPAFPEQIFQDCDGLHFPKSTFNNCDCINDCVESENYYGVSQNINSKRGFPLDNLSPIETGVLSVGDHGDMHNTKRRRCSAEDRYGYQNSYEYMDNYTRPTVPDVQNNHKYDITQDDGLSFNFKRLLRSDNWMGKDISNGTPVQSQFDQKSLYFNEDVQVPINEEEINTLCCNQPHKVDLMIYRDPLPRQQDDVLLKSATEKRQGTCDGHYDDCLARLEKSGHVVNMFQGDMMGNTNYNQLDHNLTENNLVSSLRFSTANKQCLQNPAEPTSSIDALLAGVENNVVCFPIQYNYYTLFSDYGELLVTSSRQPDIATKLGIKACHLTNIIKGRRKLPAGYRLQIETVVIEGLHADSRVRYFTSPSHAIQSLGLKITDREMLSRILHSNSSCSVDSSKPRAIPLVWSRPHKDQGELFGYTAVNDGMVVPSFIKCNIFDSQLLQTSCPGFKPNLRSNFGHMLPEQLARDSKRWIQHRVKGWTFRLVHTGRIRVITPVYNSANEN